MAKIRRVIRRRMRRLRRRVNPGKGRGFTFHGSFTSLILAQRRERATPGSFIMEKNGRYYVLKPKKIRSNKPHRKARENPNGLTKIYGKVLRVMIRNGRVVRVEAQKTQQHRCDVECRSAGHRYYHDFKRPPVMGIYGTADHQRLIIQ